MENNNESLTQKKSKLKLVLQLFGVFFKIGAFTFGGGYAMIPLIQKETAENRHWISNDDILDIIAIAESTPGPLAINTATFVGYKTCGFFGSVAATLGVVLPSFLIIFLISTVLKRFEQLKAVKYAFYGIRAGVLALILKALWSMYRQCKKSVVAYVIMSLAFVAVAVFDINVLWVIIGCGVMGLVSSVIIRRKSK